MADSKDADSSLCVLLTCGESQSQPSAPSARTQNPALQVAHSRDAEGMLTNKTCSETGVTETGLKGTWVPVCTLETQVAFVGAGLGVGQREGEHWNRRAEFM